MSLNARLFWGAATLVLFFLILRLLGPILMPFALASVFAYIGDPLVDRLEEHKLGRTPAVALGFFGLPLAAALARVITRPRLLDQTP